MHRKSKIQLFHPHLTSEHLVQILILPSIISPRSDSSSEFLLFPIYISLASKPRVASAGIAKRNQFRPNPPSALHFGSLARYMLIVSLDFYPKIIYLSMHPPRPLASRRVDAPTKIQTLQTSQNVQTKLLGGGFTSI